MNTAAVIAITLIDFLMSLNSNSKSAHCGLPQGDVNIGAEFGLKKNDNLKDFATIALFSLIFLCR